MPPACRWSGCSKWPGGRSGRAMSASRSSIILKTSTRRSVAIEGRAMSPRLFLMIGGMAAAGQLSAAPVDPRTFPARVVVIHNYERARIGIAPLVWDNSLGTSAAAYAQQMAFTGGFAHSDRRSRPRVGENLWMGTHGAYTIEAMIGAWALEKRYFVPGIFPAV